MSRESDDAKRTAERIASEQNVSPEVRVAAAQVKATVALVEAIESFERRFHEKMDEVIRR